MLDKIVLRIYQLLLADLPIIIYKLPFQNHLLLNSVFYIKLSPDHIFLCGYLLTNNCIIRGNRKCRPKG